MTEPASWPLTDFEATPPAAVVAPSPVAVPAPEVWAKVTEVELSAVTRLPAASRISAVSVRAAPEERFEAELVTARWSAAPWTTVKVEEPAPRPVAVAPSVIEPASWPVTGFEATPLTAVAAARPVTVPVPAVFANATEVELSPVTRLSAASRISAVSVRAAPETRFEVALVTATWSAGPGTIVKLVALAVSPVAVAWIVTPPTVWPVTVFEATPLEAVAAPSPVTVPEPLVWAKETEVELSAVTRLPAASRTSAVSVRVVPEARLPVPLVTVTWSAAPGTTAKVVEPEASVAAEAPIVIEPASVPVTVSCATPLEVVATPRPATVPAPPLFAKVIVRPLSVATRLLPLSRTSAVSCRVAPEARSEVELVITICVGSVAGTTLNVIVSAVARLRSRRS